MAKADGLLPKFLHFQTEIKYTEDHDIEVQLENVTDHDWVEVVRCKDCRYFYDGYDEKCCINHRGVVVTDENGFCHHAERRDEDG